MLQIQQLAKYYGTTKILDIPSLNIQEGITWIQGKNGSGKSTLLKIAAGLLDFQGTLLLDDISQKKQPITYRRLVNFGESEPLFPDFLCGNELISLFNAAKRGLKQQIQEGIEGFELTPYLSSAIGSYSAGMTKKLSLLLAFVGNPRLILLDEPFITLDESSIHYLCKWIKQRQLQENISFIITSHQTLPNDISPHRTLVLSEQTILPIS